MGYADAIKNGRTLAFLITSVVLFLVVGPMIEKCSEMPGSPQLQAGQRIMFQMAGRANLRAVGFLDDHPDAKPSQFVTMIANDPDHPLWPSPPPKKREMYDVAPTTSNRIAMPSGLVFSANTRTTTDQDEIVYRADDDTRELVVIGFSPQKSEPTFEYRFDFPTKAGKVQLQTQ